MEITPKIIDKHGIKPELIFQQSVVKKYYLNGNKYFIQIWEK